MDGTQREKAALLDGVPNFERFFGAHYRASGVTAALQARVFAAWRKVGLNMGESG